MVKRGLGKDRDGDSFDGLLITVPFAALYCATKHARGAGRRVEGRVVVTGVEVCTANPGVYGTGF